MKYMQNGGFQKNPFMRLTLSLTLVLLMGFVITNFLLYFTRMDLTAASVISYYRGSEEEFRPARTFQSMLEVAHFHLPMMALLMLMLTHLVIFAPFSKSWKISFILIAFLSALLNEAAGWFVLYVSEHFAWLKITSFLALQGTLIFLLTSLGAFLWRWQSLREENGAESNRAEFKTKMGVVFTQEAPAGLNPEPTTPKQKTRDTLATRDEPGG